MLTAPVAVGIMVTAPQAPKLVERIGTKLVVVTRAWRSWPSACCCTRRTRSCRRSSAALRAAAVRRRHGPDHRAGHRVDHGLAAARPRPASARRSTTPPARPAARSASPSSAACSPPRYHRVDRACRPACPARPRPMVHDSIGKALEAVARFNLPADAGRRGARRGQRTRSSGHAGGGVGRRRRRRLRRGRRLPLPPGAGRTGRAQRRRAGDEATPSWPSLDDGILT